MSGNYYDYHIAVQPGGAAELYLLSDSDDTISDCVRYTWTSPSELKFRNYNGTGETKIIVDNQKTLQFYAKQLALKNNNTDEDRNTYYLSGCFSMKTPDSEKISFSSASGYIFDGSVTVSHGAILRMEGSRCTLTGSFELSFPAQIGKEAEKITLPLKTIEIENATLDVDQWSQVAIGIADTGGNREYGIFPQSHQLTLVNQGLHFLQEGVLSLTKAELRLTDVDETAQQNSVVVILEGVPAEDLEAKATPTPTPVATPELIQGTEQPTEGQEETQTTEIDYAPGLTGWLQKNEPTPTLALGGVILLSCAVIAVLGTRLRRLRRDLSDAKNALAKKERTPSVPPSGTLPAPAVPAPAVPAPAVPAPAGLPRAVQIQNIGRRSAQQDSMGFLPVSGGLLAVLADGMGGLSDGDKVSQLIVRTMLGDAANRSADEIGNNLMQLLSHANAEVNQMLGPGDQYKSGSTLLAVAAEQGRFRWISVGDSRIYLYRTGNLIQINHEHVFKAELLNLAVNRMIGFSDALSNPQGKNITSFLGMGKLKYIDLSLNPVLTQKGDRIALMSDGVFNALSEREIADIFAANPDGSKAAEAIDQAVRRHNDPHQDNYSMVLIDY